MAAVLIGAVLGVGSLAVPFAEGTDGAEHRHAVASAAPAATAAGSGLLLTDAEKAWLAAHPRIRVSLDPGWPPINARDAISGEGAIVVAARNRALGEEAGPAGDGLPAGEYLELRVTDTGRGIEPAVLQNIFEPFFTTKEIGRGTGLGLAMVYGIVKQSRGGIRVESEVGRGSAFVLLFPRVDQPEATGEAAQATASLRVGRETILLVEDEAPLLRLARTILESLGYRVYPAASPEEALRVAGTRGADIHLLISDMVMPGMNGLALSKRLREIYPALKCLFISGYSADVVSTSGEMPENIPLLQKPFSRQELADKVREVLDAPAGAASSSRPD